MAEGLSISLNGGQQGEGSASSASRIVQMVALITILSLAPGILVMMTSFTRIIVVLSLLRTAIGMQQSPPNAVMTSFAMFLTAFIMAPTMEKAYNEGIAPMIKEEVNEMDGLMKAANPFRQFMLKHAREKDLQMFSNLAEVKPKTIEETPFQVVIPAFMISELRRAFEIGFLIFMPFLIIDMVVASILMAMGMMMLPPATISLPFKIIFFVLVDGWHLIAGSLVRSYGG
ncbi:MAG: flagellar type III secretion system pore protein FliP [Alphaproteobacteria bacterium]